MLSHKTRSLMWADFLPRSRCNMIQYDLIQYDVKQRELLVFRGYHPAEASYSAWNGSPFEAELSIRHHRYRSYTLWNGLILYASVCLENLWKPIVICSHAAMPQKQKLNLISKQLSWPHYPQIYPINEKTYDCDARCKHVTSSSRKTQKKPPVEANSTLRVHRRH